MDILTGEVEIIRADLVYDMGKSINPATDVGQIEGAFMQGVGRVLLEDVVTQMTGPNQGQNNTPNTWGYKIPATTTVPRELNVDLYPRANSSEVPENPNLLMSAKEVGEPPLCMATTVYFALKHAILDSRTERGKPGWFRIDMPCTVQRVREALDSTPTSCTLDRPPPAPHGGQRIARTRLTWHGDHGEPAAPASTRCSPWPPASPSARRCRAPRSRAASRRRPARRAGATT